MTVPTPLAPYKLSFLEAAISSSVLKFGTFLLKSGRRSPYFFNAGDFYRADLLRAVSTAYAEAIIEAQGGKGGELEGRLEFDIVFGPAYKG